MTHRPNAVAAAAEERLKFANSWNRGFALVGLFRANHPRRLELLGQEWSCCDGFPDEMRYVVMGLPRPTVEAMTSAEREALAALGEVVTVWRGCYEHNREGMSWSLEASVAAHFPTLNRYQHEGTPLLLEGRVRRCRIAFLKLDRDEAEVVCDPEDVDVVALSELSVSGDRPRPDP